MPTLNLQIDANACSPVTGKDRRMTKVLVLDYSSYDHGSGRVSGNELAGACFLGSHVAGIAAKLAA